MALRTVHYIGIICVFTLVSLLSLGAIVYYVNPITASAPNIAFFYLSSFLSTAGIGTLLGLGIRSRVGSNLFFSNLSIAFRQAFLLGLLVVISLGLQAEGLLYWWVEISLLLFFVFVEAFFNLS